MKRWISVAIYMIILLILLTGCVQFRLHVTVNRDGTASLEVILAADKAMSAIEVLFGEDLFSQVKANFIAEGYEVETYEDPEMKGFIAKKTFASLDEVSTLGISQEFTSTDGASITTKKSLFHTTHHVSIQIKLDELSQEERTVLRILRPDIRFALTLPVRPLQHNADFVTDDGKTLEWLILPGQENSIEVSVRAPNTVSIILVSLLAVFLPVALFFFLRSRRLENTR